ncbi:hypothetical protein TNCV_2725611 [Trichonephila clavipes]|nr:hypothetical protein TNCV_2725611 [Trichonephila clavipes]
MRAIGDGPRDFEHGLGQGRGISAGIRFSKLPHQPNGRILSQDKFNVYDPLYTMGLPGNWGTKHGPRKRPQINHFVIHSDEKDCNGYLVILPCLKKSFFKIHI